MKRRFLSGVLSVLILLGTFSACGSAPTAQQPMPEQPPVSQEMQRPEPQWPESQGKTETAPSEPSQEESSEPEEFSLEQIPAYTDLAYIAVNNNNPYFTPEEMSLESFEYYSPLDELGRCGVTIASIGRDLMPTEDRESIGMVKPTGWITARYDHVEGKYLYNRCHLIGFQLCGENANNRNLITGTRYLNIEGMLPFENMVADYVKETENHVMYRVTPIFQGDELVARGVLMEGYSLEDQGEGICFCIYAYNVQPGVEIDYATGESQLAKTGSHAGGEGEVTYIVNVKTEKFHRPDCSSVEDTKKENKIEFTGSREEAIAQGYEPCGRCKP